MGDPKFSNSSLHGPAKAFHELIGCWAFSLQLRGFSVGSSKAFVRYLESRLFMQ